ncbi:hypothetical protein TNIN_201341 [Trichonephila inaurata madagascariensis]|uniref:Uncharacterized protein n=1 Tax=Trichonephila inaurata madagascariensis TaxID=2747483 RepID=A0A8X6YZH2_9ARAC|nr:hypothetical protein TNIN_201341 [Trichonephila inaurata madagascariensis]
MERKKESIDWDAPNESQRKKNRHNLATNGRRTTQNAGFEQESSGLGAGPPVAGLSAAGRNARAGLRTPLPGAPGIPRKLSLQIGTVRQKELSK